MKNQASVVITRYDEPNRLVRQCLESLKNQIKASGEVIFLDQDNDRDISNFIKTLTNKRLQFKYINIPKKSLSFARNYGIKISKYNYVLFCDVDCVLENNWIAEIIRTFVTEKASIVVTKILPVWEKKTKWFHSSKYIREFYSLLDLSNKVIEVNKVIGASFGINKKLLGNVAQFKENLGRKDGILIGGEETELCERIKNMKGVIAYTPFTFANHSVSSGRMSILWLFKRAYYEGYSRASKRGNIQPFTKKANTTDKLCLMLIAPFYVLGYLIAKFGNL